MKQLASEIGLITEIYQDAWSESWAFSPVSHREALELLDNLRWFADPDLVFFICYDHEPAGVAIFLPDVNQVLKRLNGKLGLVELAKAALYRRHIDGMRGVLFGIKKKYQRFGVSLAALDYLNQVARKKNYRHVEFSWILEDNLAAHRLGRVAGARIYKRYRIYKKAL
jgi:GNAT superfamily N-acetyltransferase